MTPYLPRFTAFGHSGRCLKSCEARHSNPDNRERLPLPATAPPSGRPLRRLVLAAGSLACLAAAPAQAEPLPEPALKRSDSIALPVAAADGQERALLRLEWHAGQSRADEAGIVDDMLARLQRMSGTVAEIGTLMRATPAAAESAAPATVESPPPAPETAGGLPWLAMAVGAMGFFALGWLWRQRTVKARSLPLPAAEPILPQAPAEPVAEPSLPTVELATPHEAFLHPEPPQPRRPFVRRQPQVAPAEDNAPAPAAEPGMHIEELRLDVPAVEPPAAEAGAPPEAETEAASEQSLELAEIMMSMGLSHGAAQTLMDQISKDPRHALYYWLKLLEVYRRAHQRTEFEAAAQGLRQHFNVQALAWEEKAAQSGVEDYPHIAARICELWPKAAVLEYLQRLLADNRGGTRAGFPQSVAEEILLLSAIRKLAS